MDGISEEKITVNPTDIFFIKYDHEIATPEEVYEFWQSLKKEFPDRGMVCVPKGLELKPATWKSVYDYIMSIRPKENEDGN